MAASYTFEDLSGTSTSTSDNPYDGLIEACHNNPVCGEVQARYNTHRTNRATQQKAKLLAPDFAGVTPDSILARLEDPTIEPGFKDWRHCLVFWARPPKAVRDLIVEVQKRLLTAAPNLWLMPATNLHMTALEITHSLTAPEIDALVSTLRPSIPEITDYTYTHRARVVKPLLSYDAQALALSYLPAAGEPGRQQPQADAYTYHHLRRDLHSAAEAAGVKVASRYVVPSAHLTIGRFITTQDFATAQGGVDHGKVAKLVSTIEDINAWLEAEYWPREAGGIREGGEWVVGEERGLDNRKGALWYGGGGETVRIGKGS